MTTDENGKEAWEELERQDVPWKVDREMYKKMKYNLISLLNVMKYRRKEKDSWRRQICIHEKKIRDGRRWHEKCYK